MTALLDEAAPDSWGRPEETGLRRYAGRRDDAGRLVAVAGEGWSAPGVGFVAGVATRPGSRSRGSSTAACAFVSAALVRERGAALLHDTDNAVAARLYDALGFTRRPLLAGTLRRADEQRRTRAPGDGRGGQATPSARSARAPARSRRPRPPGAA